MPHSARSVSSSFARVLVGIAAMAIIVGSVLPADAVSAIDAPDHLVVSEVVTGGASASDELIELYNPTASPLPLEGLELVYVTASGATITRRAAWTVGAPSVAPGGHVLVANEVGIYAPIADAVYASGMAATGGSVAIRIAGASTAIDAVGWGTAASTWREGSNAPAPAVGSSIERLPGGALGSTQDTDANAADFIERIVPEPQNLASPATPADPGPSMTPAPTEPPTESPMPTMDVTPTPSPSPSPSPSTVPTASATASPAPTVLSVADARAAADGTIVTMEATALTASDFHDGGGFVADASGGIAILVEGGLIARGERVRLTGEVDDRFSQRTLRATIADVVALGPGTEPLAVPVATGAIDEAVEGRLVSVAGTVVGAASVLTTATAFDIDDGSGAVRVVVQTATGIDVSTWTPGARVELIGVIGQRDSTGSGVEGYRVMPRDADDVTFVGPAESSTPSPTASASSSSEPTPTPSIDPEGVISIAAARAAAKNARVRIRGVVTLGSGVVDAQTAVVQDATGAIVLRLSDDVRQLALGEWIEVAGTRSTKSGMETLRVTEPPMPLGTATAPAPHRVRTGEASETDEALLVVAAGAIVANARRASSGSISFEIDDGSGPLRVSVGSTLDANDESWTSGTWVEVTGVLGQETTGAQPLRGYRIWPRTAADVRVVAGATEASDSSTTASGGGAVGADLDALGGVDLSDVRVAATLVAGPWPELGIGGLLWDGHRLVAIVESSAGSVTAIRGSRPLPLPLELGGLSAAGTEPVTGASLVSLGSAPGELLVGSAQPAAPRSTLAVDRPAWVSLVGRLEQDGTVLETKGERVPVERLCNAEAGPSTGTVALLGVAAGDPTRLIVPCGGVTLAPAIALAAGIADPAVAPDDAATGSPRPTPEASSRPGLVAALLALAALLLGVTSAWYWRRGDAAPADDAGPEAADATDQAPAAPRLTLVSMPREHGP